MALFEAIHAQNVAFALQRELGYHPDRIRFALFVENGVMHGLVTGRSHLIGNFSQIITPNKGEDLMGFVRRCALWGGSQLAPYSTALYLLQKHAADKDFADLVTFVEHAKSLLPATPISFDRALLDNVLGLVALFRNDPKAARKAFNDAMTADPTNAVPFLNAAFTDLHVMAVDRAHTDFFEEIGTGPTNQDQFEIFLGGVTNTSRPTDSDVLTGWYAGGGIQYALNDVVRVGAEYRHCDFGDQTFNFRSQGPVFPGRTRFDLDSNQLTFRVNIMLGRLGNFGP